MFVIAIKRQVLHHNAIIIHYRLIFRSSLVLEESVKLGYSQLQPPAILKGATALIND